MPFFFLDPQTRRTLAVAAVVLSITGLVLADRGGGKIAASVLVATGSPHAERSSPTSSLFDGQGAAGRLAVSHGRVLANGRRRMYAEMRIRASDGTPGAESRAPVAMVLVVDTSGSMAGRKIEDARRATQALLDQMRDEDRVSIVRFSSRAEVLMPMSRVGEVRDRARTAVGALRAEGNTDIARALRVSERELADGLGASGRIVLVTDGRDTSGAPRRTASDVAHAEAARGFTVSALGIGTDYDDAYLAEIADQGRGNYEFLRDTASLARFLDKELRETARTTVTRAEAELELPEGMRVIAATGASWDHGTVRPRLSFGSLFAGDERRAIVTLDVDAGDPGEVLTLGGTVSWRLVDGDDVRLSIAPIDIKVVASADEVDASRDGSVVASVVSVESSRREAEAAAAFERGDRDRALELNALSRAELDRAAKGAPAAAAGALAAQKQAYEGHQGLFATAPPAAAPAREIGAKERKNADRAAAY